MMYTRGIPILLGVSLVACQAEPPQDDAVPSTSQTRSIERLAPAFDAIAPPDAVIEVLAEGHGWTEGPVWVEALGGLLYSDIPANAIYLYREDSGSQPWIEPAADGSAGSGASNGLILDAEGRLLLAQHGDRRLARLASEWSAETPRFETLASSFEGSRFNSPNDLIEGPDGSIYFTDPPYGLAGGDDDAAKELASNGVYRLTPDGEVEVIDDTMRRPNGIALSPDARTLYVASSDPDERFVRSYPVGTDGSVGEGRLFADSWGDGMAVDEAGNVYVAEPMLGVFVFDPEGRHIGSFLTEGRTANVGWGDDGSTLYITAGAYLMRVRLDAIGLGF